MNQIPKRGPVVAIDGPAGTGKSSATGRLADALAFIHVDTGALYRSVALVCLRNGMDLSGEVKTFAEEAEKVAREIHIEFRRDEKKNPHNRVFCNGEDITGLIRTQEVSMAASRVSSIPGVRAALLGVQRRLGCEGKTILEGRDIGTVIFPDADVKFFLSASVDERAKRRLIELEAAGKDAPSFEQVKKEISERDRADSQREVAPLKKADDAMELDTTQMTLDEVVAKMEVLVRKKLK